MSCSEVICRNCGHSVSLQHMTFSGPHTITYYCTGCSRVHTMYIIRELTIHLMEQGVGPLNSEWYERMILMANAIADP